MQKPSKSQEANNSSLNETLFEMKKYFSIKNIVVVVTRKNKKNKNNFHFKINVSFKGGFLAFVAFLGFWLFPNFAITFFFFFFPK